MGLYNSDGSIAVTVVDGTQLVGIQAPDGSINVVINDGTTLTGRQHPSGALNAIIAEDVVSSASAPNGSIYIAQSDSGYAIARPHFVYQYANENLLANSQTPVLWTSSGVTTTQFVDLDHDLEPTATRITEFANLSGHSYNSANISFTSGQTYTFSIYAKYETAPYIQLLFGSAAFGVNAWGNFDIQAGTVQTKGSAATTSIESAGNGWYRLIITATATGTANATVALFCANAGTMTRAASYTGVATNTRLITKGKVEQDSAPTTYTSTEPTFSFTGNTGDAIVGAIRWDAWQHPTEDTIRTAMETSLGPAQYQWRLPFFCETPTSSTAVCTGDQSDMDDEIAYAVEAGLDYWAFFWYGIGSTNGMDASWNLYQSSPYRNSINWCLYIAGVDDLAAEVTNNMAGLVSYMQQDNYQFTAEGRPLIYVYDDSAAKTTLAADIAAIRSAASSASLPDPYIVFTQSTPDDTVITTYGFDATTSYAIGGGVAGAQPFTSLDTAAQARWAAQAAETVDVVPMCTMGWDRRPRVTNTVPWETPSGSVNDYYYPTYMEHVSNHIDACLNWVRTNPTEVPSNTVLCYAWNEHDEGGWICPTKANGGVNKSRLNAVKAVLGSKDMQPPVEEPPPEVSDGDMDFSLSDGKNTGLLVLIEDI